MPTKNNKPSYKQQSSHSIWQNRHFMCGIFQNCANVACFGVIYI